MKNVAKCFITLDSIFRILLRIPFVRYFDKLSTKGESKPVLSDAEHRIEGDSNGTIDVRMVRQAHHERFFILRVITLLFCLYVPVMLGMEDPNWQKVRFMKRVLTFTRCSAEDSQTLQSLIAQLKEARELNQIPQNILTMQDNEGDTILHLLARIGNDQLFNHAIYFGISRDITNLKMQTVEDVLNEQILEAQNTVDTKKLNALGECLATYKSVYLKPLYCLVPVPMDKSW